MITTAPSTNLMVNSGAQEFRQAMRLVPTSVAVVTTIDDSGNLCGVTIGSLSSLSLEPTLLTWSLQKKARSHDVFSSARNFGISVLTADQSAFAKLFSSSIEDRFSQCSWFPAESGVPLIVGCSAHFEGVIDAKIPAGDHTIFVGRVERIRSEPLAPLVHHDGHFASVSSI